MTGVSIRHSEALAEESQYLGVSVVKPCDVSLTLNMTMESKLLPSYKGRNIITPTGFFPNHSKPVQ